MKSKCFFHLNTFSFLSLMFLFLTGPSFAGDYNTAATFSADNVSTVAPGDSRTLTLFEEFWGLSWDVADGIGNPVYGDGDTSNDNTGFYAGIESDGKIGVYAEAYYDYGRMDISAPLDINMQTTDRGATTTVNTDYSILPGAGFNTTGADGSVDVGFVADVHFAYTAAASVLGEGISTHDSFDPLLNVSLFEATVGAGQVFLSGATAGIVDFDADLPTAASTAGTVAAVSGLTGQVDASTRTASTSQSSSLLTATGDLDWLFTVFTGVPLSLEPRLSNDFLDIDIGITATALDAAIVADVFLNRNFDVTMTPKVHLEFDRPVFVEGISGPVTDVSTLLGSEISINSQDIVGVETTYSLDWSMRNRTRVEGDVSLKLTAGELSAYVDLPGLDPYSSGIGPLYESTFTSPSVGTDIYNERWSLAGQEIAGAEFLLNFDSDVAALLLQAVDETTGTFSVSSDSLAARSSLKTIIDEKNTATPPEPDAPKDLFTENSSLYNFLRNSFNLDYDGSTVDYLNVEYRGWLMDILQEYDPASEGYFQFLLDGTFELGIDFQPLFDGETVTGLMAYFYSLDEQTCTTTATSCYPELETMLRHMDQDNLLDTSLAFFYNDMGGMTDLTVYRNSTDDPTSFAYAYSSLEQYIEPVPEPSMIILFITGLLGLLCYKRNRNKVWLGS